MFQLQWTIEASRQYESLKQKAVDACAARKAKGGKKASKAEGLFKQVHKAIQLLRENPRHPGLHTHEFHSLPHPYEKQGKVFEAYVQNKTSGAYRIFWCYGPDKQEITLIAITPHP